MDLVPTAVAICLYHGISDRIEQLKRNMDMHEKGIMKALSKLLKQDFEVIQEAINYYERHCILSFTHLEEKFQTVTERYNRFMNEHFPEQI